MILSKRRSSLHNFQRDTWRNLWSYGSYGYFDSQQNGPAINVSAKIVSWSCFYWNKYDCTWGTKVCSGCWCNMPHIRQRLMRCHWSFDPQWVKISGYLEHLGPCESTSHFVNNRHLRVKTLGSSCTGGFGQTDGRRKFKLGIPKSRDVSYIRGASYIREKTVFPNLPNKLPKRSSNVNSNTCTVKPLI